MHTLSATLVRASIFLAAVVIFLLAYSPAFALTGECTGGSITRVGGNTIHSFLSLGAATLDCSSISTSGLSAKVLIVGGGGAGASMNIWEGGGGGGGGGGFIEIASHPLAQSTYAVYVGKGGTTNSSVTAADKNGESSSFDSMVAQGGGGGSINYGANGGSGGGGAGSICCAHPGGTGTSGQGSGGGSGQQGPPYAGGGGGGAGGSGVNGASGVAGAGGTGLISTITGSSVAYAGGGGGGAGAISGAGGSGGGGAGGASASANAGNGASNTGGGGGGGFGNGGSTTSVGGNGGSGVVIVSYTTPTAANDTQAPTTPANLAASAVSQTQINVSWSAATDNFAVAGYRLFRNGGQVISTTATSFQDVGLQAGTTYSYTVEAFDVAGNTSALSGAVSATTHSPTPSGDTQAPSVPTGLIVTATSQTQLNLTWTASTDNVGVVGYKIYRNGAHVGTSTGTVHIDAGLTAATTYSYSLAAYDAAGNVSAQSASVQGTTLGIVTPPPPPPPPSGTPDKGSTVITTDAVSVRAGANINSKKLGTQPKGATGVIEAKPETKHGYYKIDFGTGVDGWVESSFLLVTTPGTTPTVAIQNMRTVLEKLEAQVRVILARINELKAALTAAAAQSL